MAFRFLLVSLNIDAILGEVTISGRRRKLEEMAKGKHLRDAYAATIDRMKAQKEGRSALGMEALMWVSNAERPLHTSELCHALGVKKGSTDLDHENVPEIRTILRCSLGLIAIEASSSTVRLVHFTLHEYLSNNPGVCQSPHTMIAEGCLTYLNFRCVRELSSTLDSAPSTVPLVEYASRYWGKHIRMEKTEFVSPLALELLIGFEQHISSQLLLLQYHDSGPWWDWCIYGGVYGGDGPNGFTGLHGASFLGIAGIVAALLGMKGWDINAMDTLGRTALAWAAVGGHEEVVSILLQQEDINPNTPDTQYDRTPLLWAAERGHERVVKLLLEREDINPNTMDTGYGRTPLLWAAARGHQGVVKLLLERGDIDPNTPDTRENRTPLSWSAEGGYEGVANLLLERVDTNPDTADSEYYRTPLWWAASGGHEGIVSLLLEQEDINPNTADVPNNRTPLWWAASGGHEGIVGLLLEQEDINPNTADIPNNRTPLWWAARGGHEGIVRFLSEREDTNPNTADIPDNRTPLWWAASGGHERIIRLLLQREDINPNTADISTNRTPLWWAASGRHEGIVRLLLERVDINPNTADLQFNKTPLSHAASGGHEGIVRLLLEREDINPNTPDSSLGRTPLTWAVGRGHEEIVKLLLERNDLNPNIRDHSRKTALEFATSLGHAGLVRLLSQPKPSLPIPIDAKQARSMGWKTPPQGDSSDSNNKRTFHSGDEGNPRKKHRASPPKS